VSNPQKQGKRGLLRSESACRGSNQEVDATPRPVSQPFVRARSGLICAR